MEPGFDVLQVSGSGSWLARERVSGRSCVFNASGIPIMHWAADCVPPQRIVFRAGEDRAISGTFYTLPLKPTTGIEDVQPVVESAVVPQGFSLAAIPYSKWWAFLPAEHVEVCGYAATKKSNHHLARLIELSAGVDAGLEQLHALVSEVTAKLACISRDTQREWRITSNSWRNSIRVSSAVLERWLGVPNDGALFFELLRRVEWDWTPHTEGAGWSSERPCVRRYHLPIYLRDAATGLPVSTDRARLFRIFTSGAEQVVTAGDPSDFLSALRELDVPVERVTEVEVYGPSVQQLYHAWQWFYSRMQS